MYFCPPAVMFPSYRGDGNANKERDDVTEARDEDKDTCDGCVDFLRFIDYIHLQSR